MVSTTSLLIMDLERKQVDLMIAAAGGTLMSIEHDGIAVRGASEDTVKSIRDAMPWPARAAGDDWTSLRRIEWSSVLEARRCCLKVLSGDGDAKFSQIHTTTLPRWSPVG